MKHRASLSNSGPWAIAAILAGIVSFFTLEPLSARDIEVQVKVPLVMPADAREGQKIYEANCRRCHGPNLSGSENGPPLILYEKGHHGDGAFLNAVRSGVKAHHWEHGDMPPLEKLTDDDVKLVVRYVRELQKFNDTE
jgi:mono/diheme cytochrome c family protein